MSYLHEWRPDLTIGPSRSLALWLGLFHGALLVMLPFASLATGWWLLLECLFLGQWLYLHRRYAALGNKHSVIRLLWMEDGWMLEDARGMQGPFRLSPASRIGRDFLLLHFRRSGWLAGFVGGSVTVPLVRDNIGDERFHLLQIFMRWQRSGVLNPGTGDESL